MAILVLVLALLAGLVTLVCWILTLIKMFPAGVGHFVVGLICGLYALIWSWQNRDQTGPIAPIWTVALLLGIVARVMLTTR